MRQPLPRPWHLRGAIFGVDTLPERPARELPTGLDVYDETESGWLSDFELKMSRLGCGGKIDEKGQVHFSKLFEPPAARPLSPLLTQTVDVDEILARQKGGCATFEARECGKKSSREKWTWNWDDPSANDG